MSTRDAFFFFFNLFRAAKRSKIVDGFLISIIVGTRGFELSDDCDDKFCWGQKNYTEIILSLKGLTTVNDTTTNRLKKRENSKNRKGKQNRKSELESSKVGRL